MYYSQNFKEKIGKPVSGGTVITGTLTKLGKWRTDSQIADKLKIQPLSIHDFFATVDNLITTGKMKKKALGYLFYVKANNGRTLAVNSYWNDKQWDFYCNESGEFGKWHAELCVFSPAITLNPSTPSLSEPQKLSAISNSALSEQEMISALKSKGYTISKTF